MLLLQPASKILCNAGPLGELLKFAVGHATHIAYGQPAKYSPRYTPRQLLLNIGLAFALFRIACLHPAQGC